MYYVYILKSEVSGKLYIGYTTSVKARFSQHNNGVSKATKPYRPWRLTYIEGYATQEEALEREEKLKQYGRVYSQLKRRIRRSLQC